MPLIRPDKLDKELATTQGQRSFYIFVFVYLALLFLGVHFVGITLSPYAGSAELIDGAENSDVARLIPFISSIGVALCLLAGLVWVYLARPGYTNLVRGTLLLMVLLHLLMVGGALLTSHLGPKQYMQPLMAASDGMYLRIVLNHVLPALLLAWTLREALLPLVTIYLAEAALLVMAYEQWPAAEPELQTRLLHLALAGLPGLLLCWVRQGGVGRGSQYTAYREAYDDITQEIQDARKLHENLFPEPIDDGPVCMDYFYRPMTQLGGDYLHTSHWQADPDTPQTLVCTLIDVTGHGLRASLAVNQLHALLEHHSNRDQPPDPGELMADLNRHLHANCGQVGVFATALCMRMDPAENRITWCSAGHPPGIVISHGSCKPLLESTAPMLGAFASEDFEPEPRELQLPEGAQILAYSDGATEKRLAINKMLGVQGLCMFIGRVMARDELTCAGLMEHLNSLNSGDRDDDILLVRLGFGGLATGRPEVQSESETEEDAEQVGASA